MKKDELKLCPFCGTLPCVEIEEHPLPGTHGGTDTLYYVQCLRRDCSVRTLAWYPKEAAIASWNRRVNDAKG